MLPSRFRAFAIQPVDEPIMVLRFVSRQGLLLTIGFGTSTKRLGGRIALVRERPAVNL
jgi:hypothetical protein